MSNGELIYEFGMALRSSGFDVNTGAAIGRCSAANGNRAMASLWRAI
jgi:hypothetical protein